MKRTLLVVVALLAAGFLPKPARASTQRIDAVVQPAVALSAAPVSPLSGAVSVAANAPYQVVFEAIVPGGGSVPLDHVPLEGAPVEYKAPLLGIAAAGDRTSAFD